MADHLGGTGLGHLSAARSDAWLEAELRTVLDEETAGLQLNVTGAEIRRRLELEDRLHRRSGLVFVALAAVLLAALAIPLLQPMLAPVIEPATPSITPGPSPSPRRERGWMGDGRTAIVIRWDGQDLARVLANEPDGKIREIATLRGIIARAAPGYLRKQLDPAAPAGGRRFATPRASDQGFLAIPVVAAEPADGSRRDGVVVVDLRDPEGPTAFIGPTQAGSLSLSWGPAGDLAVDMGNAIVVFDPVARTTRQVAPPPGVTVIGPWWAADGSGLLAQRLQVDGRAQSGILRFDGLFVPGEVPLYAPTGTERIQPDGWSVHRGGTVQETAVTRTITVSDRSGREVLGYSATQDLGKTEPMPLDSAWDASGRQLLILAQAATDLEVLRVGSAGAPAEVLGRIARTQDERRVDLVNSPVAADPGLDGFSPDDSLVLVSTMARPASGELIRAVWIVDTASGLPPLLQSALRVSTAVKMGVFMMRLLQSLK